MQPYGFKKKHAKGCKEQCCFNKYTCPYKYRKYKFVRSSFRLNNKAAARREANKEANGTDSC